MKSLVFNFLWDKKLEMDGFSQEYVLMPWDDKTTIITSECSNESQTYSRWELIQKQLCTSKISDVEDLVDVIKSYNVVFDKNGQQQKPFWKCSVLFQYFAQVDESEKKVFFEDSGVLSSIRHLAIQLKDLVPKLKLLKSGFNATIKLHQLQIASILSGAFFCIFPKAEADCPSINFNTLYEGTNGPVSTYYIEKLKCLLHYFKRIHKKEPSGNLSFHRLNIPDHKFPRWDKTTAGLCTLTVDVHGKIEDQQGFLQMDFANRYIGGGVLGRGCVQEEIRFLISPELIAARLFTECLADNESVFIVGAERYCDYTGYSNTFAFGGDYNDSTPFDECRQRKTYLIILDALYFRNSSDQYRESKILRELKKAYVGFKAQAEFNGLPLATGNWGCGAFGGDPQLKSLLQLMASSQAHRDILYLTFGNFLLKNQIEEFYITLKKKGVTVGALYRIIKFYNRERKKNQTVFEFVLSEIRNLEEKKFLTRSTPSTSRKSGPAFGFSPPMQSMKPKRRIENVEGDEFFFPEMEIDFENLDKEITEKSREFNPAKSPTQNSSEQISGYPEVCSNLIDMMWYECERGCEAKNVKAEEQLVEKHPVRECSPSLVSCGEAELVPENSEKNLSKGIRTGHVLSKRKSISDPVRQAGQLRRIIQPKITDCFFKK